MKEVINFFTCDSIVATLGYLAAKASSESVFRKCVQKDDESHVFAIIRVLARYDGDFVSKKILSGHE